MATNTKQAIREAEQIRRNLEFNYSQIWESLFHNSVKLSNNMQVPKRYLLTQLFEKGSIAYFPELKLYLPYAPQGIDIYGLPLNYVLYGANGFVKQVKAKDVVILRANDLSYPLSLYFEEQARKLIDIDTAISQNIEATRTMSIMQVPDQSLLLSQANAQYARRIGATIAFYSKGAPIIDNFKSLSTGAEYHVNELLEARRIVLNETLATIGISSANTDKRERVQSFEVTASQGFAKDMLSTLVDTFNYDAEQGGIPDRLEANTSLFTEESVINAPTLDESDDNGDIE